MSRTRRERRRDTFIFIVFTVLGVLLAAAISLDWPSDLVQSFVGGAKRSLVREEIKRLGNVELNDETIDRLVRHAEGQRLDERDKATVDEVRRAFQDSSGGPIDPATREKLKAAYERLSAEPSERVMRDTD